MLWNLSIGLVLFVTSTFQWIFFSTFKNFGLPSNYVTWLAVELEPCTLQHICKFTLKV